MAAESRVFAAFYNCPIVDLNAFVNSILSANTTPFRPEWDIFLIWLVWDTKKDLIIIIIIDVYFYLLHGRELNWSWFVSVLDPYYGIKPAVYYSIKKDVHVGPPAQK